jgi:cell division protein FtsI/penicillin-binding protein 2
MAMAAVVASVAAGHVVVPRLLLDRPTDPTTPEQPLTRVEAHRLRAMMRAVVLRGSGALLAPLPGPPVIAKTGTAEYGTTPPLPTHAWMVAAQGDLAVAVFVDTGESGSHTAGPILRSFLESAGRLGPG